MPNQGKIINAVNHCLKQKSNIDFEFNKTGICAGLASIHIKYALEKKEDYFFSMLDRLSDLPSNYKFGDKPDIDDFIIQIEKACKPSLYSGDEVQQGELEKLLHIGIKPIRNEFNLGLITDEPSWKEIFKKIAHNDRAYFIGSKNHGISLLVQNGKYRVYDPNYNKRTKEFDSVDELIKEIKDCFEYKENSFGLDIRSFANPYSESEQYPTHAELYQIAFASNTDQNSSSFAALARDSNTLSYLFKENKIDYANLAKEFLFPEFNDLLLAQPQSAEVQKALLLGIDCTLYTGKHQEAEKLIEHYLKTYTSLDEQNQLKEQLGKVLHESVTVRLGLMRKSTNYDKLLQFFDRFNLAYESANQTNYNHIRLLNLISKEASAETIYQYLSTLSTEQITKQIQYAAITNQTVILNFLVTHLTKNQIDPKSLPSLFNKEVIQCINAPTLFWLIKAGFVVNVHEPDLLSLCMQRKDKAIFEAYLRSWLIETKQEQLWTHINRHESHLVDLKTKLGSTSLLSALVFLRKNELIKQAWVEDIPEETIQEALTLAILDDNQEMSLFLQQILGNKQSQLEEDTLEYLYTKGLEENDLSILSAITQLNFNVLRNVKDIRALFSLCYEHEDYSIIESCFEKASPKIKALILEFGLNWNIDLIITLCGQKAPHLFNNYLNESLTEHVKLSRLNRVLTKIPPNILSLQQDEQSQKKLIKDLCKHGLLQLAKVLNEKIAWENGELNEFLDQLIQEKNENGILVLLRIHPNLQDRSDLISLLAQNNLFKSLDFVITADRALDADLTEQIFTASLTNNYKNLVAKFLNQKRITPASHLKTPIEELLKQAIEKGYDSVLEPFIQLNIDFGINFKNLFLFSGAKKQVKIANHLLEKEFPLTEIETQNTIEHLFGDQLTPAIFDEIYLQGHGRLYELILKANFNNPRDALLKSIKNPEKDPKFKHTELYLNPLKRAIKEKNQKIFDVLFSQSKQPSNPDSTVLNFLSDPLTFSNLFPLFEKIYSLKKLLIVAIQQNDWVALAHLISTKKMNELDADIQQFIHAHNNEIAEAYLNNLPKHYEKMDVRPQLFTLLDDANTSALAQLAFPYRERIRQILERIELDMLDNKLDLNNQIYRYSLSNVSLNKALAELNQLFDACQKVIQDQNIDIGQPIYNQEIIHHLSRIKAIMAEQSIMPYLLSDEYNELLEKLVTNQRIKQICELEFKLYCYFKQFEHQKPVNQEFNTTIKYLYEALEKEKLPIEFVLPTIQMHLRTYQQSLEAKQFPENNSNEESEYKAPNDQSHYDESHLDKLRQTSLNALTYYLSHRVFTLNIFSYLFDFYCGQIRAIHYQNLINAVHTEREVYLIQYAILANSNGSQLKKDITTELNYPDQHTAKIELKKLIQRLYAGHDLGQLDKLIESMNRKVNASDETDSDILFRDELQFLKQIGTPKSDLSMHSFFQLKKPEPKDGFWECILPKGIWG